MWVVDPDVADLQHVRVAEAARPDAHHPAHVVRDHGTVEHLLIGGPDVRPSTPHVRQCGRHAVCRR